MQLRFGKYAGRDLADVPRGYLTFLLNLDRLDDGLRREVRQDLRRRGERYIPAAIMLADLEEMLTARVSEDPRLDYRVAAIVSDHLLEVFEQLREQHGIGDVTELTIAPHRPVPGGWQSAEG